MVVVEGDVRRVTGQQMQDAILGQQLGRARLSIRWQFQTALAEIVT